MPLKRKGSAKKSRRRIRGRIKRKIRSATPINPITRVPPVIKVYTTPTCPYCLMAKIWLTQKRILFKEVNVLENDRARAYILAKSGSTGVPQIEIGNKVIVGFDREALEKALLKYRKR